MIRLCLFAVVILAALKFTGALHWSWLSVFAPLWAPLGFIFAILAALVAVALLVAFCKSVARG